jgi:inhibitor of KinA
MNKAIRTFERCPDFFLRRVDVNRTCKALFNCINDIPVLLLLSMSRMNVYHPYTIFPLGDSALTVDFGNLIDEEINRKVLDLFRQMKEERLPFILDLLPAYSSLTIYYDVAEVHALSGEGKTAFETMADIIEAYTSKSARPANAEERLIEVPVCYNEKYGPHLPEFSEEKGISVEDIIEIHTSKIYRVYMIGFLPGFAYMGEVEDSIAIARRAIPSNVVPGSVGIAGKQTGIYPLHSPGGWTIIGRTPLRLFNKDETDPVLFHPGDNVKFYSITENEFANYKGRRL